MAQFRKKPATIEAITFNELVEYGIKEVGKENLNNDEHYIFKYKGHQIIRENDRSFFIPTLEGNLRMTPQDMLITGVKGEIYPCKIDIFELTYDAV